MNYYVSTSAHNTTVFYGGEGRGSSIKHHEQEAMGGHACPTCSIIRTICQQGSTVQRTIVFETEDEQAAPDHEIEQLDSYGPDQPVNCRGGWLFHPTSTIISLNRVGSTKHVSHHSSHPIRTSADPVAPVC